MGKGERIATTARLKTEAFLKGSAVPSDPVNLTNDDERAVLNAINALSLLSRYLASVRRGFVIPPNALDTYWRSGIFSWLSFLVEHYHPPESNDPDFPSRWDTISYVSFILEFLITVKPSEVRHGSYQCCLELAIRLWKITAYDHMRVEYSIFYGWSGPLLAFMGQSKQDEPHCQPGIERRKILESGLITEDEMNGLLIRRLLNLEKMEETNYSLCSYLVCVVSKFVPFDTSTGPRLLRLVRVLVKTFDYLSMLPEIRGGPEELETLVELALNLLFAIALKLKRANSVDAVCVAVEHRLIQSVAEFSVYYGTMKPALSTDMEKIISMLFKVVIIKYVPYQSLVRSLQHVVSDTHFVENVRGLIAEDGWSALHHQYSDVLDALENNTGIFISLCDNPQHTHLQNSAKMKLKQCSRCETARYCSMECQRDHWKNGHRDSCSDLKQLKANKSIETLHLRDYISICRIAIITVRDNWSYVQDIAWKKYDLRNNLQISMRDFMIIVNFSYTPVGVDVVALDHTAKVALNSDDDKMVIRCLVPVGSNIIELTTVGKMDFFDGPMDWFAGRSLMAYRPIQNHRKCDCNGSHS